MESLASESESLGKKKKSKKSKTSSSGTLGDLFSTGTADETLSKKKAKKAKKSADTLSVFSEGGDKRKLTEVWKRPALFLFADFLMRISMCLVAFQVSIYEVGSFAGYACLMPFYEARFCVPIVALVGLAAAPFIDARFGVFNVALASCVPALLFNAIAFLIIISGIEYYIYITLQILSYYVILFEPTRTIVALIEIIGASSRNVWVACILLVWLRELAVVASAGLIIGLRNFFFMPIVASSVALVCLASYALIIFLKRPPKSAPRELMIWKMFKCYVVTQPNVNKATHLYVITDDDKFTPNERYCTLQVVKISKALSSLVIFYTMEQLLILVWQFQSKLIKYKGFQSLLDIHFKLSVLNLINIPLIFLIVLALKRIKRLVFLGETKTLSFAIVFLLASALFTSVAQLTLDRFGSDVPQKFTPPSSSTAQLRIMNLISKEVVVNSNWTDLQKLLPYSIYISEHYKAEGYVSTYLEISGTPQLTFAKSIFNRGQSSISILIHETKVRRSHGYDEVHLGPFDARQNMAILAVHSDLSNEDNLLLRNINSDEKIEVALPQISYLPNIKTILPGEYEILNEPAASLNLEIGAVTTVVFFTKNETQTSYMYEKQYEPLRFPPWSLVGLYFLSLAFSLEAILMTHFVLTESPQDVRCLLFAWYYLVKCIGLYFFHLVLIVTGITSPSLALFCFFWLFIGSIALYRFWMYHYQTIDYKPPTT